MKTDINSRNRVAYTSKFYQSSCIYAGPGKTAKSQCNYTMELNEWSVCEVKLRGGENPSILIGGLIKTSQCMEPGVPNGHFMGNPRFVNVDLRKKLEEQ